MKIEKLGRDLTHSTAFVLAMYTYTVLTIPAFAQAVGLFITHLSTFRTFKPRQKDSTVHKPTGKGSEKIHKDDPYYCSQK